jgi:hypothetical protein
MTSPRSQWAALRRQGPLIVAAVGLVPALTACAGAAAEVPLPAKPAANPAAVTAPAALTPRQQVTAALTGYTTALGQADNSRSKSAARRLLRPYLAASRIGGLVQAMSGIWARGETFYGTDVVHVSSVRIAGARAFVHDCDDTSGMGLVTTATGQIVPGSAGVAGANLVTRLDLVGGHWLVEFQLVEDVPCTP